MPVCKNNPERSYTGTEPSPKGLGFCASGEVDGTKMRGKDGNMWIKTNDRWVKHISKRELKDKMFNQLVDWWKKLASGGIIFIYKNGTNELILSNKKTIKAQNKEIAEKWLEQADNPNVVAIIWSAQSIDILEEFIDNIFKITPKPELNKMLKMKKLETYLLKHYETYFNKYIYHTDKDMML